MAVSSLGAVIVRGHMYDVLWEDEERKAWARGPVSGEPSQAPAVGPIDGSEVEAPSADDALVRVKERLQELLAES